MDLLDELRSFKPYLKARLKQIEKSSNKLCLRDEVEDIELYLDVMKDILADQRYGVDQLKGYIEKIHDMMRKNPVDEMKQEGTKSKYGHVRYQPVEFKEDEDESLSGLDNSGEIDEWGMPPGENSYAFTRRGQNKLWSEQQTDTIFGRDPSMQKKKDSDYTTGFGRGRGGGFPNQRKMETEHSLIRGDIGRGKNVPLPCWLRDDDDMEMNQRPGPMNDNYFDGDVNWNNPERKPRPQPRASEWDQNQSEKWKDLEKYRQKLSENFERRSSTATRSGYPDQEANFGTFGEEGPEQCPELSSTVVLDSPVRPSNNAAKSFPSNYQNAPNGPPLQGAFASTSQPANYGYPVYPQPYPYSTPLPPPHPFLRPNWNSMNQQNAGGGFPQRPPNLMQMNFGQPNLRNPFHGFNGRVPPGGTYGYSFPGNIPLPPQPLGADVFQNDHMYFLDPSPANPVQIDAELITSAARKCFNRNRSSTMPFRKSFAKKRYFTSKSAGNQDPRLNCQDKDKSSTSTSAAIQDPRLNRQDRDKSAPATPETATQSPAVVHRIPRDPKNTIPNPCFSSKATQSQKRKLDETRERVKKSLSTETVSRSPTLQELRKKFENKVLYKLGPISKKQDELQTQSQEKEDEPPPDETEKGETGSTVANPSNKTGKVKTSKPPTKPKKSINQKAKNIPKKSINPKAKSLPKALSKKQPTSAKSSPLQTLMKRNGYKIPKKSQPKKVVPIYDSSSDSDDDHASSLSNTTSNSNASTLNPAVVETFRKHLLETLGADSRVEEMDDEQIMDMINSCATEMGEKQFLEEIDNTGGSQLQSQRGRGRYPSDARAGTSKNMMKSTKRPTRSSSVDRLYKDLEDAGKGFGLPVAPIVRAKKRGRREISPEYDPESRSSKQSKKRRRANQVVPKIALKKSGPVTRAQALAKKAKSAKKVPVLPPPSSWQMIAKKANLKKKRTLAKFVDRLGRAQVGAKDIFVNQNLNKIRLGCDYESEVRIKTDLEALKNEPENYDEESFDIENHVNFSISEVDNSTSTPNTDLCIVNVLSLNQQLEEGNGNPNISADALKNGDRDANVGEPIFQEEENPTDEGAKSSEPAHPS